MSCLPLVVGSDGCLSMYLVVKITWLSLGFWDFSIFDGFCQFVMFNIAFHSLHAIVVKGDELRACFLSVLFCFSFDF